MHDRWILGVKVKKMSVQVYDNRRINTYTNQRGQKDPERIAFVKLDDKDEPVFGVISDHKCAANVRAFGLSATLFPADDTKKFLAF
jgi:hypothetical protein